MFSWMLARIDRQTDIRGAGELTLHDVHARRHHNERHGVSNHWRLDCLLNNLFGGFPSQGPVTREMFPFHDVIVW